MENVTSDDYIRGGIQKSYYAEDEREYCLCPLCGSEDFFKIDDDKGLQVVQCKRCDLIYTNPRAKNSEENYFGDADTFYNEAALIFKGKKPHHRDKNYTNQLNEIKKIKTKGKLLDVGANMGFFLRIARNMGFDTEGVEPSPSLTKIAVEQWNLKIHCAFLEDANLPKESYDIITLIDVFEHVAIPKALLKTCSELLKPDGIIVIKVPNGDYNKLKMKLAKLTAKDNGIDIWDCCEHVAHYTPSTFKKMAESCGFRVKKRMIPLPIHPPIWPSLVGHCYQYPSPHILDWKRVMLRNIFYWIGSIELLFRDKSNFGPDLMFIIEKK